MISPRFRLHPPGPEARSPPRPLSALLVVAVTSTAAALLAGRTGTVAAAARAQEPTVRYVPADLTDTGWLETMRAAQLKAGATVKAFHDFQFTDRLAESGITFKHRIVDDAGKTYKAVHYDHGNGLAIADVDGDGLARHLLRQPGRRQPALEESRRRQVRGHHGGGRRRRCRTRSASSASFADIDNDGDADLYVTTVRGGNMLFENDGHGRFKDITAASGLDYVGHSSAAVFFDYDRDGQLDLFLVNVGRYTTDTIAGDGYKYYVGIRRRVLRPPEAGARRAEHPVSTTTAATASSTSRSGLGLQDLSWSGDASAVDVNDDGWPDLYVLNMQGDDQYYENVGGKSFVKKSRQVFPRTSWGAMGIKVFDFNNDGRLDIFITDMHSDMSDMIGPEREKMKSTMKWPASFRGERQARASGATRSS